MRAPTSGGTTDTTDHGARFGVFCALWAVAHLIDVAEAEPDGWDRLPAVLVVSAAVLLLHRPSSLRLSVLAAAHLVAFGTGFPPSSNHAWLLAAVNVAIVAGSLGRGVQTGGHRWMPVARVVLLIGYSAAALSKYNDTFFDPVASCATYIADKASYGVLGEELGWPLLLAVVGTETAIALLLLIPRTRWLGVRIGVTVHFVVSASPAAGVRDFTATLFALFSLFAPEADLLAAREWLAARLRERRLVRQAQQFREITAAIAGATLAWMVLADPGALGGASWLLFSALGLAVVIAAWRQSSRQWGAALGRLRMGDAIIVAAIAVVAAGPYLGLGTAPAFTPFSNLRTEGPGTNHFFLPSIHLTDHQNEIVEIESTTSPALEEVADAGFDLTAASVRVAAISDPDLVLVGQVLPAQHSIAGPVRDSLGPPSFWERRILSFRPVADPDDPTCTA